MARGKRETGRGPRRVPLQDADRPRRHLLVIVPMVVVVMAIVMMIVGLTLIVVAAGACRPNHHGYFSFGFGGNQSQDPEEGEEESKIFSHDMVYMAIITPFGALA
jgi:hypothetical protein